MGEGLRHPVAPDATPRQENARAWHYSRLGSVILSIDFLVSLSIGLALGLAAGRSDSIGDDATSVLLAYAAVLVGLAAFVIAAHTLVVTLLSPEYLEVVKRAGGVAGVSRPYKIVTWVCAVGALSSLAVTLIWAALPGDHSWTRGLVGAATFMTA